MTSNLLTVLHSFVNRVAKRPGGSEGFCERYNFFIESSPHGKDCAYARKCLDLFLSEDYPEIRILFLALLAEFRTVEGEAFGRETNVGKQ
jgi:hypothetical protein